MLKKFFGGGRVWGFKLRGILIAYPISWISPNPFTVASCFISTGNLNSRAAPDFTLYPDWPSVGQLDQRTIKAFCQENNIKLIIDVCPAHAQIIWQLAINYATLTNIPPFASI